MLIKGKPMADINNVDNENMVPKFRMIKFGDEFEAWDTERKIRYLKKLASSMNQAADSMQQERNALLEKLSVAKTQLENAEKNLAIQKAIVFKSITDTNSDREEYIQTIQLLERKIRDRDATIDDRDATIDMLNEQLSGNIPAK
jgi:predicted  nucleic acid-binding Zn-ribbon protein